jgi:hypothetical protein
MNNIISSLVLIFAIDNYTSDVSITYIYVCNAILENRGPHSYWFKQTATGTIIDTNSNGLVNLLHYEDAAAATVALTESTGILIRLTYHLSPSNYALQHPSLLFLSVIYNQN